MLKDVTWFVLVNVKINIKINKSSRTGSFIVYINVNKPYIVYIVYSFDHQIRSVIEYWISNGLIRWFGQNHSWQSNVIDACEHHPIVVCHASWSYTTTIRAQSLETICSDSSFPLGHREGESPKVNANRYSLVLHYLKSVVLYSQTHSLLQWTACAKCTSESLELIFDIHLSLTFQEEVII